MYRECNLALPGKHPIHAEMHDAEVVIVTVLRKIFPDLRFDAQLFPKLAGQTLLRRFSGLQLAAGKLH